jgi:hypothetical protein
VSRYLLLSHGDGSVVLRNGDVDAVVGDLYPGLHGSWVETMPDAEAGDLLEFRRDSAEFVAWHAQARR